MIRRIGGNILSISGLASKYSTYAFVLLLTGMFLLSAQKNVFAMYDAVVPSSLTIHTDAPSDGSPANDLVQFGYWGMIVGTDPDNDIAMSNFMSANFTSISNTTGVIVTEQDFELEFLIGSISNNEVAGAIVFPFNSIYDNPPYILGDESTVAPGVHFWSIALQYPYGYEGNVMLNSSVQIGGETLNYETNVSFMRDNSGIAPTITGAQRLSAVSNDGIVPEPVSTVLFLTGGGIMAGRSYLKKRKKSLI